MESQCPFIDPCPVFKHFRRVEKIVYMDLYCQGDYPACHRHRKRVAGEPVPENLLPNGYSLPQKELDGAERQR